MNKLAVNGGQPVRNKPFPSWPVRDDTEKKLLLEVLDSGNWWYGEKVKEFEQKFAAFQDAKYGVTCSNGTVAIEIALITLGIGAGDEVIVPAYTFVATAAAVLKANAVPVFADVNLDTFNIDADQIEKLITPKTKAIVLVHFAGLPSDMDKISAIAKKYNLKVVEDAAHAWGSKWNNKGVGAIGDMGTFSFQASKNISAGEGGIILTNDKNLADLARSYTNVGRMVDKPWYEHYLLGGNYRITEFQAAVLLAQMSRLEQQTLKREENAGYLNTKFEKIDGIQLPVCDKRVTQRSYHIYNFRYISDAFGGLPREKFISALNAEGIPVYVGYPHPVYKNPLFQNNGEGPKYCPISCPYYGKKIDYTHTSCPNSEKLCAEQSLWLKQSVLLGTKTDMDDIADAVCKVRENINELLNK